MPSLTGQIWRLPLPASSVHSVDLVTHLVTSDKTRAQYLGADKAPIHLLHGVAPVEHPDRPGQPLVLRTPMAIMSLSVNGDGLEVRERHVRICLLVYVLEFAEWRRFEVEFHLVLDEPTN